MKIKFLGPKGGAKPPYSFPKLGVSGLIPGNVYEVSIRAGRILIDVGLAQETSEPTTAESAEPEAEPESIEAVFEKKVEDETSISTDDESGSVVEPE